MYKIKETKSGDFIITAEEKFFWWTKTYYLCGQVKHSGAPTPPECERAHFSTKKKLDALHERLFFETLAGAKEGLAYWQAARNKEKIEEEKYINEHTPKENGKELELP